MGTNDPRADKLKPKSRGLVGASTPSKRVGDPRQYRGHSPLMDERFLGEGLYMDNAGRIAVDFDVVARAQGYQLPELYVPLNADADTVSVDFNMPLAEQLLFQSARCVTPVDLTYYRQVLFFCGVRGVPGFAGSTLALEWSPTFSETRSDYLQLGSAPVRVAIDVALTCNETEWIDLVPEARAHVFLGPISAGGNGVVDPEFGNFGAYFRR